MLELPKDDQRFLARVLPATLLAAADPTEGEPTLSDIARAKAICDPMERDELFFGRRPTQIEAAGLMGTHLVPGEEAEDEEES